MFQLPGILSATNQSINPGADPGADQGGGGGGALGAEAPLFIFRLYLINMLSISYNEILS